MFYNLGLHPAATSSLHSMYAHFRAHAAPSVCTQCDVLHLTSNSHSDTPLLSHRGCWQFCFSKLTHFRAFDYRPDYTFFSHTCITTLASFLGPKGTRLVLHISYQWCILELYNKLELQGHIVCREYYTLVIVFNCSRGL